MTFGFDSPQSFFGSALTNFATVVSGSEKPDLDRSFDESETLTVESGQPVSGQRTSPLKAKNITPVDLSRKQFDLSKSADSNEHITQARELEAGPEKKAHQERQTTDNSSNSVLTEPSTPVIFAAPSASPSLPSQRTLNQAELRSSLEMYSDDVLEMILLQAEKTSLQSSVLKEQVTALMEQFKATKAQFTALTAKVFLTDIHTHIFKLSSWLGNGGGGGESDLKAWELPIVYSRPPILPVDYTIQKPATNKILAIVLLVVGIAALIIGVCGAIAAGILLTGGTLPAVFAFVGLKLTLGVGISGIVAGLASTIAGGILLAKTNTYQA